MRELIDKIESHPNQRRSPRGFEANIRLQQLQRKFKDVDSRPWSTSICAKLIHKYNVPVVFHIGQKDLKIAVVVFA